MKTPLVMKAARTAGCGAARRKLDAIQPDNAAALVAAGLVSVIVFPLVALPLLSRGRESTDVRSVEKRE